MRSTLERDREIAALFRGDVPVSALAIRYQVKPPAIWKALRRVGALPPYGSSPVRRRTRHDKPPPVASLPPRVNRAPCPRCGIRADIGCGHSVQGRLVVSL